MAKAMLPSIDEVQTFIASSLAPRQNGQLSPLGNKLKCAVDAFVDGLGDAGADHGYWLEVGRLIAIEVLFRMTESEPAVLGRLALPGGAAGSDAVTLLERLDKALQRVEQALQEEEGGRLTAARLATLIYAGRSGTVSKLLLAAMDHLQGNHSLRLFILDVITRLRDGTPPEEVWSIVARQYRKKPESVRTEFVRVMADLRLSKREELLGFLTLSALLFPRVAPALATEVVGRLREEPALPPSSNPTSLRSVLAAHLGVLVCALFGLSLGLVWLSGAFDAPTSIEAPPPPDGGGGVTARSTVAHERVDDSVSALIEGGVQLQGGGRRADLPGAGTRGSRTPSPTQQSGNDDIRAAIDAYSNARTRQKQEPKPRDDYRAKVQRLADLVRGAAGALIGSDASSITATLQTSREFKGEWVLSYPGESPQAEDGQFLPKETLVAPVSERSEPFAITFEPVGVFPGRWIDLSLVSDGHDVAFTFGVPSRVSFELASDLTVEVTQFWTDNGLYVEDVPDLPRLSYCAAFWREGSQCLEAGNGSRSRLVPQTIRVAPGRDITVHVEQNEVSGEPSWYRYRLNERITLSATCNCGSMIRAAPGSTALHVGTRIHSAEYIGYWVQVDMWPSTQQPGPPNFRQGTWTLVRRSE